MRFRVSNSILQAVEQGRIDDAVLQYLGKPLPETPQMQLGKIKHEVYEQYVKKHRKLHPDFDGINLDCSHAMTEQKLYMDLPFTDDTVMVVSGVVDLIVPGIVIDYKTGKTDIGSYLSGKQLDIYKMLVEKNYGEPTPEGRYLKYNPYTEESEVAVKFFGSNDDTLNYIYTYGSQLYDYITSTDKKLLFNYEGGQNG